MLPYDSFHRRPGNPWSIKNKGPPRILASISIAAELLVFHSSSGHLYSSLVLCMRFTHNPLGAASHRLSV